MNFLAAVIAGIVSTLVMTGVMGMPAMDIVGMMGSMFSEKPNRTLGMVMHMMMGIVFALIYTFLWSLGIGEVSVLWGILFGIAHWLVVGLMMGVMPMMHAGIQAGTVNAPGVYMVNNAGMMAFMGGLIGHVVFGVVVAITYGLFIV